MAHYYGELQGSRGLTSRLGGKSSGVWSHIRGWNKGVYTEMYYDEKTNSDHFRVYKTKGSSGGSKTLIFDSKEDQEIKERIQLLKDYTKEIKNYERRNQATEN